MVAQLPLFGGDAPSFDAGFRRVRRHDLGRGAWVEHVDRWIDGTDAIFRVLERGMAWRLDRRVMYEREVVVPRLRASVPRDGPGHPLFEAMAAALGGRYGAQFDALTLALYRDGRDGVAWHRDRDHRDRLTSVVAVASLGGPRRFLVRPRERAPGARSLALVIETGDLVVMGGSSQRVVEHHVPKVARACRGSR